MLVWYRSRPGYAALRARAIKERDPEAWRAYQREQYRKHAESRIARTRDLQIKHPERNRARRLLQAAVKKGWIIRPGICERCSEECKPHAHHRNYSLAYVVEWLCRRCHGLEHRTF